MGRQHHLPLLLSIDYHVPDLSNVVESTKCIRPPRQLWASADTETITEYRMRLDKLLSQLNVPIECINCKDLCCSNYEHISDVQCFHDCLIDSCIEASGVIPVTKLSKSVPGWNEHVEKHKHTAQLWHFIWKQGGSPRDGEMAKIMRRTRSKYHYAIRYVKTNEQLLRKNAMAKTISENNS